MEGDVGRDSSSFMFVFIVNKGKLLKERIFFLLRIFSPLFGDHHLSKKTNRKPQKLFPLRKMAEKDGGIPIYLK